MPSLPSTFPQETTDLISSARRHQTDLLEFQIPKLRSCNGPLSTQQNLWAEIREDIEAYARQVEALDISVGDLRGERNKRELDGVVRELREALGRIRQDARAALLASKRTIDSQSKIQRDELFASSAVTEKRSENEKVTDDALMKANADVTEALRRTIGLMQNELERSVLSVQMLDSSTATLRSTSSTHDTLTSVLSTSKQLVTALEKTDWLDRVLILSAFAFFVLVVLFIVKQRVLDKGVKIAFWWTRFIPDFREDEALLRRAGEDLERGKEVVMSSASSVGEVIGTVASSSLASVVSASAGVILSESAVGGDGDDEVRGSSDGTGLETTFARFMSPSASVPDLPAEPTMVNDTQTTTRTLEHSTRVVDEL